MTLAIDRAEIARFVHALLPNLDPWGYVSLRAFRQFPPKDGGRDRPLHIEAVRLNLGLEPVIDAAERVAARVSNGGEPAVFAAPVCTFTSRTGAKASDVHEAPVLSVEIDQGDLEQIADRLSLILGARPTIALHSGSLWTDPESGEPLPKGHLHWRLRQPARGPEQQKVLRRARDIAALIAGGDPTGTPPVHPLRWPGSLNHKSDPPVMARIVEENANATIDLADALAALEDTAHAANLATPKSVPHFATDDLPAELGQLAEWLSHYTTAHLRPAKAGLRHDWNNVAMAIHRATGGSEDGYRLFRAWSETSRIYNEAGCRRRWDAITGCPPTCIGARFLRNKAIAHGWVPPPPSDWEAAHPACDTQPEGSQRRRTAAQAPPQRPLALQSCTDGGIGGGGRVPPSDGPDDGADAEPEKDPKDPEGKDGQPPEWDTDDPPPDGDQAGRAGGPEAEAQVDAVPADDVLHAIDQLGPGLTLEMLVAMFNKRYAVANDGGKALVMWASFDPLLSRDRIERASFEDFKKFYCNRKLTVTITTAEGQPKKVTKNYAEWWLDDPKRCQYIGGVVFAPGSVPAPHTLNLWRGWAIKPARGDWSLMSAHILDVICAGRSDICSYVLRWLAYMVQHPDRPAEIAIVMRGLKGVGKGVFGKWLLRLCGQHGLHIINSAHLTGHFTGHLRDVIFVFADEALYAGDKQHEGILKGIITEQTLLIEAKYRTPVMAANLLHLLMSSNNDWVVPATHDERRYLMLDVLATHVGDLAYFAALNAEMENGGLAAMLHELANMDLGDFHPRKVPDTPELGEQKLHSLDSVHRWWLAVLSRGFVWKSRYGHREFLEWDEFVTTELLARSYVQWCQENRINYPASRVTIGKMLAAIYPASRPRIPHPVYEADSVEPDEPQPVVKLSNQKGYKVGALDNARTLFRAAIKLAADTAEWDTQIT